MSAAERGAELAAAPGSRVRGLLGLLPATLAFVGIAALIAGLGLVSARFRHGGFVGLVRLWGRFPLWLFGVRLETHGRERVEAPGPRLILFNHVSLLDLFVLAALCPEQPVVLYKKELGRVPGLGWALRSLGMIAVDRQNHEAALASIRAAGERLHRQGASVLMAPEGTRSRSGGLQGFKLGAFHLAAGTGVPIVPMIMRGIEGVLPIGSWLVRPGTVRVDYLAPIQTTDWSRETIREHAEEVRALFLQLLPPAPGRPAADVARRSGALVEEAAAQGPPQDLDVEAH